MKDDVITTFIGLLVAFACIIALIFEVQTGKRHIEIMRYELTETRQGLNAVKMALARHMLAESEMHEVRTGGQ